MKLSYLFSLIVFWFSNLVFGQVNAVLIVNNNGQGQDVIDVITSNKKYKNVNLRILSIAQNNSSREQLNINGKLIDKVTVKKSCDFDYCEKLINTIDNDFSNLIFFYSKKSIPCLQEIGKIEESSVNYSLSKDFIAEKLDYQLSNYKKNKKSTTLYFNYITDEILSQKPKVNFKSDTLNVNEGENINLSPEFSSKSREIIWTPSAGLSCSNCEAPSFKAKNNVIYVVKYLDEDGCSSNEASINVIVKSACDSLKKIEIELNRLKKVFGQDFEYEIMPISKEGGFRYDIPVKRNCATKFKLTIKDIYGKVVNVIEKDRDEILNNAEQLYGEDSDLFLFRINLKDYYREIQEGAILQIESYDDNGKKFKTYISPNVSFSGCSVK
jgi:hypothetical protein